MKWPSTMIIAVTAFAGIAAQAQRIQITSSESRASTRGPAETFTGAVIVDPLFSATAPARATGNQVTFAPGARSAWHSHPAGQILIVTSGVGWMQDWNGEKRQIRAGDVVWTPGVKHWHGATLTTAMTHIAIQEMVGGKNVDWLEHVTDEQYAKCGDGMGYHFNGAMDHGLTQEQAAEVITHLAFYAGWPNAFSAATAAKDIFAARNK